MNTHELSDLRTTAPPSVLPNVLLGTGLADGYVTAATVIGNVFVAFNERGVSALQPAGDVTGFEDWFAARFGRPVYRVLAPPPLITRHLHRALGSGRIGRLPVDWQGMSEFQRAVLEKIIEINPGEIRPYGWVAREIGRPGAVRAVGTALARNPIPLLLPCHRVVRTDGRIGRYAFGSDTKRALLDHEGVDTDTIERQATAGIRYYGSGTTNIYCYPTCRHARRVRPENHREFRSPAEAAESGYRPCKVCRPEPAAA